MFATAQEIPQSRAQVQLSYAPLVKKTAPAVVNIYAKQVVQVQGFSTLFNDPLFRQFFGEGFGLGIPRERVVNSLGSGVLVQADGLIVTNYHVIKGGQEIIVILHDRREFAAKIVLTDEKTDLALLKIEPKGEELPYLRLGDSDELEVGDLVLAIGNPFGVGQTVTSGIVSALARTTVGVSDYQFFIQTDASINPGNSGGALVAMDGALVGINSAIYSRGGGSNGVGFAIPSNMVRGVIDGVHMGGKVQRPWLGAKVQPVTADIAESLGLPKPVGVLVQQVYPGGPASLGGIKTGDVILSVGGKEVFDEQGLKFRVATFVQGKPAEFRLRREGREYTASVTLTTPPENPKRDPRTLRGGHPLDGALVVNLSPAVNEELGFDPLEQGVVLYELGRQGYARRLGFERGDIILAINREEVYSTRQLEKVVAEATPPWRITYKRGGEVGSMVVAP